MSSHLNNLVYDNEYEKILKKHSVKNEHIDNFYKTYKGRNKKRYIKVRDEEKEWEKRCKKAEKGIMDDI